jgi:hypothetical protein
MEYLKAYLAGFVSTLTVHQGTVDVLYVLGVTTRAPYAMDPAGPLHIPAVVSLAFWGGVWGSVIWTVLRRVKGGAAYWLTSAGLGSLLPTVVAWFVVQPLKGQPVASGGDLRAMATSLVVNAVWGLGVGLAMLLLARKRVAIEPPS